MDSLASLGGAKNWFFDAAAVLAQVDKVKRRALSKAGAFVRTRARSSIRRRKAVSQPGSPPTNRVGHVKKFLYFAYDPGRESVVVGPIPFPKAGQAGFRFKGQTGVAGLEKGGEARVEEAHWRGRWWRTSALRKHRSADAAPRRTRGVTVLARPFMRPAMEAEMPKFAELFRG